MSPFGVTCQTTKLLIGQLFAVVVGAGVADAACQALERAEPFALMVLDLAMPGMNGLSGVRRFVDRRPPLLVLILSAHAEPDEIRECMGLGVRGYIPGWRAKTSSRIAVSPVLAGEVYVPARAIGRLLAEGHGEAAEGLDGLAESNPLRPLTAPQRKTLALITEGCSDKEIARRLGLLESTVKANFEVILRKLSAHNRTQAALIAADLGWPRHVRARAP